MLAILENYRDELVGILAVLLIVEPIHAMIIDIGLSASVPIARALQQDVSNLGTR